MKKTFHVASVLLLSFMFLPVFALAVSAEDEEVIEVSAEDIGVTEEEANSATEEEILELRKTGMLIEIGNTTAEETTIIIRVTEADVTEDLTVQVTAETVIVDDSGKDADLSDWIAGDQVTFVASEGTNSGELVAKRLVNRAFKAEHRGRNGWVKEVRVEDNEMDVEWAGKIYTLNTSDAKMVAGNVNPASLSDFQVDDRIRARVENDGDTDELTWDAKIIVVLRRGDDLFMRVTRWVVPAEIVSVSEDTELPYTVTARVLESKFFEEGDVNNLIGAPGTEFTIEVSEKTKLVRRFLGKAQIGEFMEGDKIKVIGRLNEETGYLDAGVIKNNSIQALGVSSRISEVLSIDSENMSLVVKPMAKRKMDGEKKKIEEALEWTINLEDDAVIVEMGEEIELSDLKLGDIVRVRGVANRLQKTVEAKAMSVVTDRVMKHMEKKEMMMEEKQEE